MEGKFLWDAQCMKKVFISPHMPLHVEETRCFSSLKPEKEGTKRITKTNWGSPNYLLSCKSVHHEYLSSELLQAIYLARESLEYGNRNKEKSC